MLKRWMRKFRTQLVGIYILLVFLPVMCLGLLFAKESGESIRGRYDDQLGRDNDRVLQLLLSRVDKVERSAAGIISNTDLQNYLTYSYPSPSTQIKDVIYAFKPLVQWLLTTNTEYARIHFFTARQEVPLNSYTDYILDYDDEPWMKAALVSGMSGLWKSSGAALKLRYSSALTGQVASYFVRFPLAADNVLLLDVSRDWLYNGVPYVIDQSTGEVLFSARDCAAEGERLTLPAKDGFYDLEISGVLCRVALAAHDRLGVVLATATPASDIAREVRQNAARLFGVVALCLLLSLALIIIFTHSVTSRMAKIKKNVSLLTGDYYQVEYQSRRGDEIDELGGGVVTLGKKMDHLVNQVLMQRMLMREAELHALQAQMNPHFIFNMLETMAMMAELSEQQELADVISQFGDMVRYNLDVAEHVPFRCEIDNIRQYVELQNLMHNGQLSLEVGMDENAAELTVPRLMLQPIVENAIMHGKAEDVPLFIRVRVVRVPGGFKVSIANNGRDLTDEQREKLTLSLKEAKSGKPQDGGLALGNIQHRLALMFGEKCALSFDSAGGWVTVWFILPDSQEEGAP